MMMMAYMMQSFCAKGSQITSCFGLLVLKTLQKRITKLATVTMEKKDVIGNRLLPYVAENMAKSADPAKLF